MSSETSCSRDDGGDVLLYTYSFLPETPAADATFKNLGVSLTLVLFI